MESDIRRRIEEEIDALRRMRDELRVKVHLGAAEVQETWQKAEKSWGHLEGRLKVLRDVAQESGEDVAEAARLLAGEIREAYQHVRRFL